VEARPDQEDALVDRIDRHAACAHGFPPVEPGGRTSPDRGVDRLERSLAEV
jgi:hypothetical protein